MSSFITKFNDELEDGVAATRTKLEALKKTADLQASQANEFLNDYILSLDDKIYGQSKRHAEFEDDVEDWVFQTFEKIDAHKDEVKMKKLRERAVQAEKRADFAFSKALNGIDKAEREMLRSKIAHTDAGIPKTEIRTFIREHSNK